MSEQGYIFGCILGAVYYGDYDVFLEMLQHNKAVIEQLPEKMELPDVMIAKNLFHVSMPDDKNFYRIQMIPFALSMNHLDISWADWLLQFEELLKKLFWTEAHVYAAAENYMNLTDYHWKADTSPIGRNPPHPIEEWTFDGGPRSLERN